MTRPQTGKLLRIFVAESDRHGRTVLYEWIVRQAREAGLAGATVLRGLEGFGAHSQLHTAKLLRLQNSLPIVIEIVDTEEKIEAFLPTVEAALGEGLVTLENVEVRFQRTGADRPEQE